MGFVEGALNSVGSGAEDLFGGITGQTAADAAKRASQTDAASRTEALDYLKEREALPTAYRDQAMGALGSVYGLPGIAQPQQQITDSVPYDIDQQILNSPAYRAQLRNARAGYDQALSEGEESILRNQAMTGGFRSGSTQDNLARFAGGLESEAVARENQAYMNAYQDFLGGLRGFAGTPSNANAIAQQTAGIGQALAQGQTAAAQAQQAGMGNLLNLGTTAMLAFSDIRLKTNIRHIGECKGWSIYMWDWNKKANAKGLEGGGIGVIAQDVEKRCPEAIKVDDESGFIMVDYSILEAH